MQNHGIIYRFRIPSQSAGDTSGLAPPPVLVGEDLFRNFEKESVDVSDIEPSLERFHGMVLEDKNNKRLIHDVLAVPLGSFSNSRIGRQASVMLSPRHAVTVREDGSHVTQGMEDISSRLGIEKFYFKHSATKPRNSGINREWLWPKEGDVFQKWIEYSMNQKTIIMSSSRNDGYYVLPKRPDLIGGGYIN